MILITQLFKTNEIRFQEILKALKKNTENEYIKEIILLNEEYIKLDFNSSKIKQYMVKDRLTYKKAFDYANKYIQKNEIVILSNCDIWFDSTIKLVNNYDMNSNVIALARYDANKDGSYKLFNRPDSQDCWIFKNPISLQYDYDFELGKGGCDNRIAWIIDNSIKNSIKYNIVNPATTIKSYHEHISNIRNWQNKDILPPPYRLIPIS